MIPYLNQIVTGDALEILRTLPDEIVQTCVTSPPYYGLRDYGVEGQIGHEETPDDYIARLVEVFREVRRVLRKDGTLWVNIGDSYANDQKWGGHSSGKHQKALHTIDRPLRYTGLPGKNLIGIPWMLAFALRSDGYYLRSDIIWYKPSCLPESVEDRPTKAHEYLFLLSKSANYYYNADAIREPHKMESIERTKHSWNGNRERDFTGSAQTLDFKEMCHPLGRNKRTVWIVNPKPYPDAHFATFPPKLIIPCILAGSHPGDLVMDPFMGAGTTALVALRYGRTYTGIELNSAYVQLANKRIAVYQPDMWESEAAI